jgi:hypothetical protein
MHETNHALMLFILKKEKNIFKKSSPKCHHFWATSSFQKKPYELSKVAQLVKNCPIWSP